VAPFGGSAADDPVAARVLEIVAEQTGYPPDMLEMDLDLEADLGIDTVKQAEMFAAIRAAYDIERDDNLALRDYPTLARAVDFVHEKRPDLERGPGDAQPAAADTTAPVTHEVADAVAAPEGGTDLDDPVATKVLEIVAEQTGYPPDMLELDLDLEADLGIDTVKQAEMFAAIREAYGIERDDDIALRDYPTLGHAIGFVFEKRPDLASPPAAPTRVTGSMEAAQAARDACDYFDGTFVNGTYPDGSHVVAAGDHFAVMPIDSSAGWAESDEAGKFMHPPAPGDPLAPAAGYWRGYNSDYVFEIVRRVAERVRLVHPDKWISASAYATFFKWSWGAGPEESNESGDRGFFINETGVIRYTVQLVKGINLT